MNLDVRTMTSSPNQDSSNNHFNKHMLNLKNIAAVGTNGDARVSKNFAKMYNAQLQRGGLASASEESARKSLEVLQQVVQKLVNENVDTVLRQFVTKFFEPAFANIEKNCGKNLNKELMTVVICRRLLEEVISQMYPLPADLNVPSSSQTSSKKKPLALGLSTTTSVAGDTLSTPNSEYAGCSISPSHGEDLSPLSSIEMSDVLSHKPAIATKIFLRPLPSTANDITGDSSIRSPQTIAGRLRSLKTRKRSFSDSDHLNSPPRSVRAAAQRAAEKAAATNTSGHLDAAGSSSQQDQQSSKRLRSDVVASFAKPSAVIIPSSSKLASSGVFVRNPHH